MGNCIPSYSIRTISRKNTLDRQSSTLITLKLETINQDIDNTKASLNKLTLVLKKMGYQIEEIISEIIDNEFNIYVVRNNKFYMVFSNSFGNRENCVYDQDIKEYNINKILEFILYYFHKNN